MGTAQKDGIAVTGLGLVTPAGIGVDENWRRVLSGRSAAACDPELEGGKPDFSCRVPGFDAAALLGRTKAWRYDRFVQLAIAAAREAVADSGLDPKEWDGARVAVVVGNSLGGSTTFERQCQTMGEQGPGMVSPMLVPMSMVNMVAGYVAIDIGAKGPSLVTATACASGTTAVGYAQDLLRSGACDVAIAGGSESAISPTVMAGLNQMGALSKRMDYPELASRPFDTHRDGFVAAEGAGILVLERAADAHARGASVHAYVSGYGASSDAHHATAPDPQGHGVERAVRAALADAGLAPEDIGHVNAHGTSTPMNDVTEARGLYRVFGEGAAVCSTKGVTGHPLAAAGAIEAAYTVLAVKHGRIPPTANLTDRDPDIALDLVAGAPRQTRLLAAVSNSAGFGGHNAALVVTAA
ncbi:beta-ketoacyl-[acyl-carrier-protein] synthase family protein [Streptomyces sp. NPDC001502]|uniref:beta-ketoacyl-[acyl-carrier-protein] synthase family protein n=1 Tax=Streptomyces sp. NPDC001502 TaxID=3364578 RepID=UPI0036BBD65E